MLSTVCSGKVTRNLLRYEEYMYVDSMYRRTSSHVYFYQNYYAYILHCSVYL